ncbi:MAG TPA: OmpH family outer membrane protein [Pyrinomonadaceae bacterium]
MKKAITAVVFAAATSLSAFAQQPAAGRTPAAGPATRPAAPATSAAPQGGGAAVAANIAIIDITAFGDEKAGIGRLMNAYATLRREFKPRQDELQTLKTRYETLGKEVEQISKVSDDKALNVKVEQMQTLEKEIKRKQEDAQTAVQKREDELTGPVWDDINNALRAFAGQRGISIILEKSKLAGNGLIFVVNDSVDITRAFIADYNQRNPASAAAAPSTR